MDKAWIVYGLSLVLVISDYPITFAFSAHICHPLKAISESRMSKECIDSCPPKCIFSLPLKKLYPSPTQPKAILT